MPALVLKNFSQPLEAMGNLDRDQIRKFTAHRLQGKVHILQADFGKFHIKV